MSREERGKRVSEQRGEEKEIERSERRGGREGEIREERRKRGRDQRGEEEESE